MKLSKLTISCIKLRLKSPDPHNQTITDSQGIFMWGFCSFCDLTFNLLLFCTVSVVEHAHFVFEVKLPEEVRY